MSGYGDENYGDQIYETVPPIKTESTPSTEAETPTTATGTPRTIEAQS
jgi:hypothetical protein